MDRFLLSSAPEPASMDSFWDSFDNETDVNQTIPLIDEGPTDLEARNKVTTIFLLICSAIFFIGYAFYARIGINENNEEETDEEANAEGGRPLAVKICYMSAEERMALYNEAFDQNKHQIVMDASSIIVGNPEAKSISDSENENEEGTQGTSDDSSNDSEKFDEDSSIYLALKDARAFRRSTILRQSLDFNGSVSNAEDDINHGEKRRERRSSIVHPRRNTSSPIDIEQGNPPTGEDDIVRGNCVICFEDIKAGETVVWSETRACNHVYHKDCMVAYLAHKKQSVKEIELDMNPCPTCRRKFVTVCTPVPQEKSS